MIEDLSLHVADLILNALRAGARRIKISLERSGGFLVLEVEDDGRGMSEGEVSRALDPFFTTKDAPHGIGLGLALVRQTAEELGGRLDVDSAPGRGTKVRLVVPYGHPDRPPLGDLAGTVAPLVLSNPQVEFTLRFAGEGRTWTLTSGDRVGGLRELEGRLRRGLGQVGLKEEE
ncbi:MAG: Histidine kinase [Acetothermia bacterium 64_32]|nr:MAG: Histidine kinase [Acetothermia bacterium 64_32]HAF69961.1 ATP-binding protein [Candidatus Acetothermia bacterium]